ncbi:NAD(P)-dependent oxidoreductase [Magnetospira sp. QH-2]|uniref:NAD-dependent epimerase/dehydratase family protein n=1 Tax=Magnetospira sp. (strain QH-2) TaxID=1288970 RepID=UPI0003E81973|nr:NAD(P)-dependent oxidoreductase [Magnetospira sp. QH-2]CCQ73060.1 GDP-L-fucose synthetase [Magnetospira sp. QH-2]
MQTALICGATGFIGRNVTQTLARRGEVQVRAVYHRKPPFSCPGVEWVKADLRDPDAVARVVEGADVMIQAAATTSGAGDILTQPHIHVTDNAVMNSLLFRAAHDQGVGHTIFFSCTLMYASSPDPVRESDFDANRDFHPAYFGAGWTKVYLEKMAAFYAGLGRTRHTVIRHSNVYGPHDKFDLAHSHVFGATLTKAMTAKDGRLVVWGSGEEARDLVYVDDLVAFIDAARGGQKTAFEIYNCGSGEAVSVNDLVARIIAASGRELRIEHDLTKPTIKTSLALDCSKAREQLGWQPQVGLDEGIRSTLGWWRENVGNNGS